MFYDLQEKENQEKYKEMLKIMGQLSRLFSENDSPYLAYRSHENIFCKYFEAENLARFDCSADAKKGRIGIGLKTWMGNDDQKIAEFGKLKKSYEGLTGLHLVRRIAEYRNERIRVTKKLHGIDDMYYHVVKRVPGAMQIYECIFDSIDINNITLHVEKGNSNNTYFSDGKHEYHFSTSKNTLYMIFDSMCKLDEFPVEILDDPYDLLTSLFSLENKNNSINEIRNNKNSKLCLPLYSVGKEGKFVAAKSGLNQWNAGGRKRNPDELYIPYNKIDRDRYIGFFPPRDTPFILHLPDGTEISAKVCQEADKNNPLIGKAIMSNPNKILGKWLLRDVFELPENTIVTYQMLETFGVDSVVFTKHNDGSYSVDFSEVGTYEDLYGEEE
ncbi:MAG: NgoFVII family restriction endonuclease [Bacillota bacterium]|nr:NgoFVII family restriction endonuclease [Bacillota bacterium]